MANDRKIVFADGNWTIETRSRNNHPGCKLWGLYNNHEIFSLDERGLRKRVAGITVPSYIESEAMKIWGKTHESVAIS